jgi:octaprenyl-diphosphate synthase
MGNGSLTSANSLTSKEVFELVRADLQKVEEEFCLQTVSSVRPITEIGQYLHGCGGKRLRPALVLLSAKLCGFEGPAAVRLATVVELIHTATLVHDDVIDEADTRRGQPSTNSRWGNHLSVLAGDWLYMRAFNVVVAERNFKILDLLVALTQTMVEGELLQLSWQRRAEVPEDVYLELTYRKTACLFSACLRLGALLAGRSAEEEALLGDYGRNLGLSFQLIDDVLDFTSSEQILGKPTGNDLREGKVTLPLIYLLQRCDAEEAQKVKSVLEEGGFNARRFNEILELIDRYGTLPAVREKAQQFAQSAKRSLETFPDTPYKEALRFLPDSMLDRAF